MRIEPDQLLPKNDALEKALGMDFFLTFRNDPFINQEIIRKDTVELFKKGASSKYLLSPQERTQMQAGQTGGGETTGAIERAARPAGEGRLVSLLRG